MPLLRIVAPFLLIFWWLTNQLFPREEFKSKVFSQGICWLLSWEMRAAGWLTLLIMSAELAWKRTLKKAQLRSCLGVDNIRHGLQLNWPFSTDSQDCCIGKRYGETKHCGKKGFCGKRQENSSSLLCLNKVHYVSGSSFDMFQTWTCTVLLRCRYPLSREL